MSFTREQLHEPVWSKPMTEIADEFGMSSVAFAKYCTAADVSRPGRGYWQQRASGQKPLKQPLTKAGPRASEMVAIEKYERRGLGRHAPEARPHVALPDRISKYHTVVGELEALAHRDVHYQGMFVVRGHYQAVLKFSESSRRRALRLLHTLFGAVEQHGYRVRLTKRSEEYRGDRGPRSLEIVIDGDPVRLSLREHLDRKPHKKTDREWTFARKYDLEPSGNLILELDVPWGADTKTRWRDTANGRLEDLLGEIVWAIGEAANGLVAHRARVAEKQHQAEIVRKAAEDKARERQQKAEEDRLRREQEARSAAHRQWLHDDLVRMANDWRQADVVRAFLTAVEVAVPATDRGEGFRTWLRWATEHVEALDPLNEPPKIGKALEPGVSSS